MSFGFKYGYPEEADLVMDVRCFANPFYVDELRHKTGLDADVREYVLNDPHIAGFQQRLYDLIEYAAALPQRGQKPAGDRHRLHRRQAPLGHGGGGLVRAPA